MCPWYENMNFFWEKKGFLLERETERGGGEIFKVTSRHLLSKHVHICLNVCATRRAKDNEKPWSAQSQSKTE